MDDLLKSKERRFRCNLFQFEHMKKVLEAVHKNKSEVVRDGNTQLRKARPQESDERVQRTVRTEQPHREQRDP